VSYLKATVSSPYTSSTGTDATIAQHIQMIIDRGYVKERMEGSTKYLLPSKLGLGLVHGYDRIGLDKSLSKPQLRREVGFFLFFLAVSLINYFRPNATWFKCAKGQKP